MDGGDTQRKQNEQGSNSELKSSDDDDHDDRKPAAAKENKPIREKQQGEEEKAEQEPSAFASLPSSESAEVLLSVDASEAHKEISVPVAASLASAAVPSSSSAGVDSPLSRPSPSKKRKREGKSPKNNHQKRWDEMYQRLVEYHREHGNANVPNRYAEDPQLGSWVSAQRRAYKTITSGGVGSTAMTLERATKLKKLGFEWEAQNPNNVDWSVRYNELLAFVNKYGHANVPMRWKENVQLSNWVSKQRHDYKLLQRGTSSRLSEERMQLLNKVNFVWEVERGSSLAQLQRVAVVGLPTRRPNRSSTNSSNNRKRTASSSANSNHSNTAGDGHEQSEEEREEQGPQINAAIPLQQSQIQLQQPGGDIIGGVPAFDTGFDGQGTTSSATEQQPTLPSVDVGRVAALPQVSQNTPTRMPSQDRAGIGTGSPTTTDTSTGAVAAMTATDNRNTTNRNTSSAAGHDGNGLQAATALSTASNPNVAAAIAPGLGVGGWSPLQFLQLGHPTGALNPGQQTQQVLPMQQQGQGQGQALALQQQLSSLLGHGTGGAALNAQLLQQPLQQQGLGNSIIIVPLLTMPQNQNPGSGAAAALAPSASSISSIPQVVALNSPTQNLQNALPQQQQHPVTVQGPQSQPQLQQQPNVLNQIMNSALIQGSVAANATPGVTVQSSPTAQAQANLIASLLLGAFSTASAPPAPNPQSAILASLTAGLMGGNQSQLHVNAAQAQQPLTNQSFHGQPSIPLQQQQNQPQIPQIVQAVNSALPLNTNSLMALANAVQLQQQQLPSQPNGGIASVLPTAGIMQQPQQSISSIQPSSLQVQVPQVPSQQPQSAVAAGNYPADVMAALSQALQVQQQQPASQPATVVTTVQERQQHQQPPQQQSEQNSSVQQELYQHQSTEQFQQQQQQPQQQNASSNSDSAPAAGTSGSNTGDDGARAGGMEEI